MNSQPRLLPGGMRANMSELRQLSCCQLSVPDPLHSASLLNAIFPAARFAVIWEQVEKEVGDLGERKKPLRTATSWPTSLIPAWVSSTVPINQRVGLRRH